MQIEEYKKLGQGTRVRCFSGVSDFTSNASLYQDGVIVDPLAQSPEIRLDNGQYIKPSAYQIPFIYPLSKVIKPEPSEETLPVHLL